jgi:Flp pilus assembly protein TadG
VEAALILPLILLVTFASLEYGWMFLKQEQLVNAARQAARVGATAFATNSQVSTQITNMMAADGITGYTVSSYNVGVTKGSTFTITISVPYSNVRAMGGVSFFPVPTTLTGTVTMEKEGA